MLSNENLFQLHNSEWILFQQRGQYGNPADYFVRSMSEYVEGFGNPSKEFWLGLDKLVSLTKNGNTELMIELETFEVRHDNDMVMIFVHSMYFIG